MATSIYFHKGNQQTQQFSKPVPQPQRNLKSKNQQKSSWILKNYESTKEIRKDFANNETQQKINVPHTMKNRDSEGKMVII